jgi:hypothetical protein
MPPISRALGVAAVLAAVLAFLLVTSREAHAYPQWQLTSGTVRCNQCHYAPAGGGLITSFGRDAAGEQLSTFGGNGAFLHGAVSPPSWLAIGADLRGAFVYNDVQDPDGPAVAVFPMQADLSARVAFGAGISAAGIIGLRGQIRDPDLVVPYQNYQPISTSRLISREHYLMWQPQATGPYLRAGRFYAPFGLRFPEHVLYVRRDLGFDHLTETYNLSGGWVFDPWELHLTVFAPDFVRHIGSNEKGFAGYYERRLLNDHLALGGQLRIASGPGLTRFIYGGVGKFFVEPLHAVFLAEANGVQLVFDDDNVPTRAQFVGAAGVALLPVAGVVITLLGEHNQVDLGAPAAWTAATALVNWFPYAHCEAQVMGRLQFPKGGDVAKTVFIQLHYFF